eukprot:15364644-Ditylum_brightwellii.AAC.1
MDFLLIARHARHSSISQIIPVDLTWTATWCYSCMRQGSLSALGFAFSPRFVLTYSTDQGIKDLQMD